MDNDLRTPRTMRDSSGALVAGVIVAAIILIGGIFLLMPHDNKGNRLIGQSDTTQTQIAPEKPTMPETGTVEKKTTTE